MGFPCTIHGAGIFIPRPSCPFLWVARAAPCHGYWINCIHTKSVIQFLHMYTIFTREATNMLNWESFDNCQSLSQRQCFDSSQDRNQASASAVCVLPFPGGYSAENAMENYRCKLPWFTLWYTNMAIWKITIFIGTSWWINYIYTWPWSKANWASN